MKRSPIFYSLALVAGATSSNAPVIKVANAASSTATNSNNNVDDAQKRAANFDIDFNFDEADELEDNFAHFSSLVQDTVSHASDSIHRALTNAAQNANGTHKPLWPLETRDYLGFLCAIFGLIIAAGGGIGGGGVLVPIYIIVFHFHPKHAIPLSNITILGGAIANTLLNSRKRHPIRTNRLAIDWDIIVMMEPSTIAGAVLGSVVSKALPSIILTTLLVIVLAFMGRRTLTKGLNMYRKERTEGVTIEGGHDALVENDGIHQGPDGLAHGVISADTIATGRETSSTEMQTFQDRDGSELLTPAHLSSVWGPDPTYEPQFTR